MNEDDPPTNGKAADGKSTARVKHSTKKVIHRSPQRKHPPKEVLERGCWPIPLALAVLDVRDAKLYREKYQTFGFYCVLRLGISRQRGYMLIEAARLALDLAPTGILPNNEFQVRSLRRLPTVELRCRAWLTAVERYLHPTGRQVERIVETILKEQAS